MTKLEIMYENIRLVHGGAGTMDVRAWGESAFRDFYARKRLRTYAEQFTPAKPVKIGGHPDYDHLEGDQKETGHITTLFVDLNRYTSRTLVAKDDAEQLSEIVRTKQLLINSLIRFVQQGDGHVHSITGDGVMAFFGRKEDVSYFDGCRKALLTAMAILYFTKNELNPLLQERGEATVQIRTGLDFSEVSWLRMGEGDSSEVKAVGYGVDLAAKLLSPSKAWRSRVGETLYNEVPEEIRKYFRPISREIDDENPVFERQFQGKKVEYKKYMFEWEKVLEDAGDNADNAMSLLESAGRKTISVTPLFLSQDRMSVDDDDVIFG